MPERHGIVCLANDVVYDFLVALAQSVARHSELPLAIIPFDDRTARTRRFARRQGIEVLDDPLLPDLDALGARVWPGRVVAPHAFRKFAAFWGAFDRFLFLDADIVVLRDPAWLLEAQAESDPDALWCFDTGEGQAYRPGPLRDEMVASGFPGISTGLFIARRGLVTLEQVRQTIEPAVGHRDQFLEIAEQPFLNFLLQRERIRVAKVGDLFDDVAGTTWAGARFAQRDGRVVVDEPEWPDHGRAPAAVHWSGMAPGPLMRHRRLFVDYRSGHATRLARARVNARLLGLPVRRLPRKARSALNVLRGRPLGAWR